MENIENNNRLLGEYRENCLSAMSRGDFDDAKKLNDRHYELLYSLYISAESKDLKKDYSKSLEVALHRGILIQEGLIGGFN